MLGSEHPGHELMGIQVIVRQRLANFTRSAARPFPWLVLLCAFALALPQLSFGQQSTTSGSSLTLEPGKWPQTVLLENKAAPAGDKSTAATGMPVMDPRQTSYDVLLYTLDITVDPVWGWVTGKVKVLFSVVDESLGEIVLDYRDNMSCLAVKLTAPYASDLSFTRGGDLLVIALPTELNRGDLGFVEIWFWGQPQPEGLFGYQVGQSSGGSPVIATVSEPWSARSWWPCKDDPTDKAAVYTTITAPEGMTAVSNGNFGGQNGRTWSWYEPLPIPTYLVSIAVSDYVRIEEQYDGPAGPIDLRHFVFPEDEADAREDMSILPEMLDFCGDLFGPYPFTGQPFGIAEIPWDEAMEHPTAVSYGDVLITGTHQFDNVLMHELAHMWFGDMISPVDWTHVWLNEGFATYAEALWAEHLLGPNGLSNFMSSRDWGHGYGWDTLVRNPDNDDPPYYFRTIAYHKGAWVLHMLRRWLGDETFFAAVTDYLNDPQLRFGTAHSLDFQRICEEVSGQDLAWFFDQWLYRTTYPILRLNWQNNWQEGANEVRVRLRQQQDPEPDGSRPAYRIPVELRFVGTGLDTTITVISHHLDQEFVIPLGATISNVIIDPGNWLLHDVADDSFSFSKNVARAPVTLLPAYPNPFNPRTVFHWETTATTHDLVEVFDVQGRRLVHEDLGEQPAGPREFLWLGSDANGRQFPSGTYLYRITCRGRTAEGDFRRQLHGKVTLAR
jgi:aminopeptidase N